MTIETTKNLSATVAEFAFSLQAVAIEKFSKEKLERVDNKANDLIVSAFFVKAPT